MNTKPMIRTSSTLTTEGYIPHQMHMGTGILCPVKLEVNPVKPTELCKPKKQGRQHLYALPGGGEMLA